MVDLKRHESQRPALLTLAPAIARLPAAVPAERRDLPARYALLRRIHSEFEEMPGLSVTPGQAARLFGLPPDIAERILERLADADVLRHRRDGQFALRVEVSR
jgi:hypothetical protein